MYIPKVQSITHIAQLLMPSDKSITIILWWLSTKWLSDCYRVNFVVVKEEGSAPVFNFCEDTWLATPLGSCKYM